MPRAAATSLESSLATMTSDQGLPEECSRVVLTAEQIRRRVEELGDEVRAELPTEMLRLVTVLRGGVFFTADLCRALGGDLSIDFLAVAPFVQGGGGQVRLTKDLDDSIENQTVVLVEDVVDTGLTVNFVQSFLLSHRPGRLITVALIDKPHRRIAPVPVDYTGFSMSDRFLVGYGLDLNGRYRNLPYIAELREDAIFG